MQTKPLEQLGTRRARAAELAQADARLGRNVFEAPNPSATSPQKLFEELANCNRRHYLRDGKKNLEDYQMHDVESESLFPG